MNNTGNNMNQFNNPQVNNAPNVEEKKKKGLFSKKKDKEDKNAVQQQNLVNNMNAPVNNTINQNNGTILNNNQLMANMPFNNNVVNNQPAHRQYQSTNGNTPMQKKPVLATNTQQPVNNVAMNTIKINNQNNNVNQTAFNTASPVEKPIVNIPVGAINNNINQNTINQVPSVETQVVNQNVQQPVANANVQPSILPSKEDKHLDSLKSLENSNTILPVTSTDNIVTSDAVEKPIESKAEQARATSVINMNINKQASAPVAPIVTQPVAPVTPVTPVAPATPITPAPVGFDVNAPREHVSLDTRNQQVEVPVEEPTEVADLDEEDEDVEFLEYEYGNAGIIKRICADIIDQFIIIILVCAVYVALSTVFIFVNNNVLKIIINVIAIVALSFGNILYRTYNERTGNTIGRKATKTIVLNNNNDQIEITTALLRTLIATIINGTGIGFIVNAVLICTDKNKKGIEDKIFNTQVIDSSI